MDTLVEPKVDAEININSFTLWIKIHATIVEVLFYSTT